jgi:hypothetical protein
MNKVFLGGTCNESTWRDQLIPILESHGVDYFNPVVDDWTSECQAEEERQKNEICNIHLYVITPKMTGVFSIAEAVESAINMHRNCVFCVLEKDGSDTFTYGQLKSLNAVKSLIKKYRGTVCSNIEQVAIVLSNLCIMNL